MATFTKDTSAALLNMAAVTEHLKRIVSYLRRTELLWTVGWSFWSFVRILFHFLKAGSQTVLFILVLNSSSWLSADVGDVVDGVNIS